jgi:tagatose-6-phosphate ketose/aldose isomerase
MSHSINRTDVPPALSLSIEEQRAAGCEHTLREICQQPDLWEVTADQITSVLGRWRELLDRSSAIVLTGSGSSFYVGECLALPVQEATGLTVRAISSGDLLLLGTSALPPIRPLLLVSFARSGDSPESAELIRRLLDQEPEVHHLVITCNHAGRLAATWGTGAAGSRPEVDVVVLDDRTCDRSLVMTSSFTNLVLAGLGLAYTERPADYAAGARRLAALARKLLLTESEPLAEVAGGEYQRMIVLGDGSAYGAARESALKTLEMTGGRVLTMAETTLGFRHGPMCTLRDDALLVVFLSSVESRRAYQLDLLDEIRQKGLRGRKIVVGSLRDGNFEGDLVVSLGGSDRLPDEWSALLFAMIGQLIAFLRCRAEGLRPDEPVENGAITRVVSAFRFVSTSTIESDEDPGCGGIECRCGLHRSPVPTASRP